MPSGSSARAVSTWASHTIFRSARQHAANREFFAIVAPATFRDFAPSVVAAAGLALFGVTLQLTGSRGWLALCGILVAMAAIAFQIELIRRYWSLHLSEPSGAEPGTAP